MKNLAILFPILLFFSCGKTAEQKLDSAKQSAKYYLTNGECSKARDALEDVGNQSDDSVYISLLASTYGCDAGYSELDLFADITNIQSASNQMLGSLTLLSSSNETQADSAEYTNLMSGIDTILASGGGSAAGRNSKFGSVGGTNLNFQALYMIIVELGKFMGYYGDAAGGAKGGGGNHTCLFSYNIGDAQTYVTTSGNTGSCVTTNGGSPDLPGNATDPTTLQRLCQGIYLFNNMRDILSNVDIGGNSNFGELANIGAQLEAGILAAEALDPGTRISTVKNVKTMAACEALSDEQIEVWYAIVFETAFP